MISTLILATLAQATPLQPTLRAGPMAADARCLAVFSAMVTLPDAKTQEAAKMAAIFYGGKMLGRDPHVDFEAQVRTAADELGSKIQPETQRCADEFRQFGQSLMVAGRALQAQPQPQK